MKQYSDFSRLSKYEKGGRGVGARRDYFKIVYLILTKTSFFDETKLGVGRYLGF
jgi:hypothetical protein